MPVEALGRRQFCMPSSVRATEPIPWTTAWPWMPTGISLVRHREAETSTSTRRVVPALFPADAALYSGSTVISNVIALGGDAEPRFVRGSAAISDKCKHDSIVDYKSFHCRSNGQVASEDVVS